MALNKRDEKRKIIAEVTKCAPVAISQVYGEVLIDWVKDVRKKAKVALTNEHRKRWQRESAVGTA